jgi:hypothetical protein
MSILSTSAPISTPSHVHILSHPSHLCEQVPQVPQTHPVSLFPKVSSSRLQPSSKCCSTRAQFLLLKSRSLLSENECQYVSSSGRIVLRQFDASMISAKIVMGSPLWICAIPIPPTNRRCQTAFFAARLSPIYSDSIDDRASTACFFELQAIAPPAI